MTWNLNQREHFEVFPAMGGKDHNIVRRRSKMSWKKRENKIEFKTISLSGIKQEYAEIIT